MTDERGLTLTELMVVGVLATIVMTGLIAFYFNSQSVWLDGSSQAITQREATLVLRAISKGTRSAASAVSSGGTQSTLTLSFADGSTYSYWWNAADSLIYEGQPAAGHPMISSPAECFAVEVRGGLVIVDSLRLRSSEGQRITVGTSVALMNRTTP